MSIESKEILDLHSIYQNMKEGPKGQDLQEVSIGNANIVVKCKDGKKRVNCTAADKAWLAKQKEEGSGPSTPPGPPGSSSDGPPGPSSDGPPGPSSDGPPGSIKGISMADKVGGPPGKDICKNGKNTMDGSPCGPAKVDTNNNDGPPGPSSDGPPGPSGEKKVEKIDYRSDSQKKIDSLGKMSNLERKNRLRFGNDKIDFLKQKQIDFKTMQAMSQMPGADRKAEKLKFINKYPNSITAQKYHGLRDHVEWDAFDMVGSYLMDSRQAESMDEALYVMMEMDSNIIQNIVKESEFELIEARRADKKGIKRGEKGNPDTDQAPSGQQPADTKTGYKARRVERREGDKRRKANKERRGWNYGGKEAAAGDLANAQRQPDADLGSQKQVTDTGAHKDKHGWRQRVSSPASGRKSESASSEREDKRYPPSNPKHKLHGKKTKKDKPQGRYKEVKENYAAVEAIRLLIEKQNKASNPATAAANQDAPNKPSKNDGTIEAEIKQIQTMPALPDKDVKKFLDAGEDKSAKPKDAPADVGSKKQRRPNRTNVGGRWYNNNLDGANDLKSNKDIA